MDLFQEMALSQGAYFNHLYMNVQPEDAAFIYKHKTNHCHGLVVPLNHHHYLQLAEGMDETNLALQTGATANATSTSINPSSLHESLSTNSLGFVSTSKQQPCEMSNAMSTCEHGNIKRRSWQETLCSAPLTCPRTDISAISIRHANSNTNQAKVPNVENILTLHHIQAAANTDPNYLQPSSLTTMKLPLEEPLIAVDDDQNHVHAPDLRGRSFLSALNHGDEAFFKQQLLVPMEDLITDYSRAISDHEEVYYSHCHHQDPVSCFMLPHGIANHEHEVLTPDELRCGYFWGHQESSAVTDLSTRPPCNMDSHNTVLNSSGHVNTNNRSGQSDNDEKLKSASEDSNQSCIAHQKAGLASRWVGKMINGSTRAEHDLHLKLGASGDGMNKLFQSTRTTDQVKKRSLSDEHDDTLYVSHSKRTHLGPHVTDTNIGSMTKHSSSATSFLTMISGNHSAAINATTNHHQPAKTGGKSSLRHPLGPALNTNLKPRARQGAANDPQTLAARNRRERINARLKTLQELVPNGSKVDLVTMLEKAINYVKFLQLQLRVLSNDELWQANQMQKVSMQKQEEEGDESKTTYNRTTSNKTA